MVSFIHLCWKNDDISIYNFALRCKFYCTWWFINTLETFIQTLPYTEDLTLYSITKIIKIKRAFQAVHFYNYIIVK